MSRANSLVLFLLLSACGDVAADADAGADAASGDTGTTGPDTSTPGDASTADTGLPPLCDVPDMHSGEGTYYDFADGSGNCGFPATPDDLRVAAMNHTDYADSAACGACARVTGPTGAVVVRVVDQCPECAPGDIDLSPSAFSEIADLSAGRVPITWTYEPCDVAGPLVYHFKDGSNQWWTAVQIRNHRHRVARLEYLAADGSFRDVTRLEYNYFVEAEGMGPGPFTLRVTDVFGDVVTDSGIPLLDDADAPGASQFSVCE